MLWAAIPFSLVMVVLQLASLLALLYLCGNVAVEGQVTEIQSMPGISDLNRCVRDVFDYLYGDAETGALGARLGCATWVCACNDLQDAGPIGISLASSSCSGNTADIAAETSLNAFCAQYTITTMYNTSVPTAAPTALPNSTAQGPSRTPAGNACSAMMSLAVSRQCANNFKLRKCKLFRLSSWQLDLTGVDWYNHSCSLWWQSIMED